MPTAISNLVALLQQRLEERPDDLAYVFLAGADSRPSTLNYRQLDFQARTVAAHLQELGLQGERVLLLYPPGLDFIAAFLGCLYAGSIAVPVYPPRMNRNVRRIVAIAEDSQATVALTTSTVTFTSPTSSCMRADAVLFSSTGKLFTTVALNPWAVAVKL